MILVRTDWPDFETYLASLSKSARKNYKFAMKLYGDQYPFQETPFVRDEIERFMELWEKQTVRGQPIRWGYKAESLEKHARRGGIKVFSCGIAMQYILKRDGYWDAEPVMYDKQFDYLATYMWFQLFQYAINERMDPINLGGGHDDWVYNLKHWKEYKHQYKFRYVPEKAKADPDSEPQYYIKNHKLRLRSTRHFKMGAILGRLFAYLCFPCNYLRIALRWRKSSKQGGGLHLRVRHFEALARILNRHRIPYVLLRGFPTQARLRSTTSQEDFDVLASALSIQKILMLAALVPGKVPVDIYFDMRVSVECYHYYPPILAQQILSTRMTHPDGYAMPDPLHHFLSLAYHVVYHKGFNAELPRPLEETVLQSKHYETLEALGKRPDIHFDDAYTLLSLHEFLKKYRFNMAFDLLKKWPVQHPFLALLYEREREKLEAMSPQYFPLVFAIRSDAGHQGHDTVLEISELISEKLEVSRIVKLSEDQIRDLSVWSRGGNWVERQRGNYYHVQPTHIIVCLFESRDRIDRFCQNELPEFKKMIRETINRKYPHPDGGQRYVIHGADDLWESLDQLRIVGLLQPTEDFLITGAAGQMHRGEDGERFPETLADGIAGGD